MVSAVDDGVGELLDKLEELNIDDNTLIFFLSDNGGPEKHNASDNAILRDGKGSLYEGGIRVPFALQWPGIIPKGLVYNKPIISLDIFATVVSLADVTTKNQIDGVNLMPYLLNKNKEYPHEQMFWRMYDGKSLAIRSKNIKLVKYKSPEKQLYNLENDTSETTALNDSILTIKLSCAYNEWNYKNLNPIFLGLKHDKQYDSLHVDRWNNIKKH
jgi:arylsulfatase A-like enzyme